MTDPMALAKKFVDAQFLHKENFVSHVDHFLSRSFELSVVADVGQLGMASVYRGARGLGEYSRRLYASINGLTNIADSMTSQFYSLGNEVVVWYQPSDSIESDGEFLFRPTSKLRFSGGLLVEQEDRISLTGCPA